MNLRQLNKQYISRSLLTIIAFTVIISVCVKIKHISLPKTNSTNNIKHMPDNKTIKKKYILQYHTTGARTLCLGDMFKGCEYKACVFTKQINMMPIDQFDAILFHEPTIYSNKLPPNNRSLFQKYIFFNHESPVSFPIVYDKDFYNITITYRRDADIFFPYFETIKYENEIEINKQLLLDKVENKTKLIAWVVSNCGRQGTENRKRIYKQIEKYIHVDVYGRCGNLTCPGRMSEECYDLLDENYKFYLAFENSYCKDYVTEKMFYILNKTSIVPIVFGFGDYKHFAPPNSYIHVDDFKSAKDLTDYLLFLDKNDEEYVKYFEWKKHYWIKDNRVLVRDMCCNLCKKLHEPISHTWYGSMRQWSMGNNNSVCPKYRFKWTEL